MESTTPYVIIPGGTNMSYFDDFKTNSDKQITVACVAFFLVAFPVYFTMADSFKDVGSIDMSGGKIGNYEVNGTFSFHEIGSGTEVIDDGTTVNIGAHSDAGNVAGMNIVGFRMTIQHTDDESGGGPQCTGVQSQDDEVSVSGGINENTTTTSGTESPMESSLYWIDSSILGTTVQNMSSGEISSMLEGGTIGFGEYSMDIGVTVNKGQRPLCNKQDSGETVDWTLELISLEYTAEVN